MGNHQSHTTVLWAWEYHDDANLRPDEVTRLEALLNTIDHHAFGGHANKPEESRDLLSTPETAKRWLVDHELLDPHQVIALVEAADLRAFRDQLRRHLELRDTGQPAAADWPPPTLRMNAGIDPHTTSLTLKPVSDGMSGALERLLADAVVADVKGALQRLKICAADDCRFAYYDHSRSRTARWCSMQTCGNRRKTRHYRQRRR